MNNIPHPLEIDGGVLAIVLQQGNGNSGNRCRFHIRKRPLQNRKAAHPDDRFDLPCLYQRHHQRGTFRHEHRITEALGFVLQILDRTKAALLTEQAEFVEWSRAAVFNTKTLRKQEKTPIVGNASQMLAPDFVAEKDADVVAINGIDWDYRCDLVRMALEFINDKGRNQRVVMGF